MFRMRALTAILAAAVTVNCVSRGTSMNDGPSVTVTRASAKLADFGDLRAVRDSLDSVVARLLDASRREDTAEIDRLYPVYEKREVEYRRWLYVSPSWYELSQPPMNSGSVVFERPTMEISPVAQVAGFRDGVNFMLQSPLVYRVGIGTPHLIFVPSGFVTDYASIPSLLLPLIRSTGSHSSAAILHDYLYWTQACTRLQSDNIMWIAMRESDVAKPKGSSVYFFVRDLGGAAWSSNRRDRAEGKLRTVPPPFDRVPASLDWENYRRYIREQGAKPAYEPRPSATICKFGDSVTVPRSR